MLWTKKPKTELQFRPKSKINGMLLGGRMTNNGNKKKQRF